MSIRKLLQTLLVLIATFVSVSSFAQGGAITGTVVDDGGNPLLGANVAIKGTNQSSKTNASGKFSITPRTQADFLIVTFAGMASKTVAVSGNDVGVITLLNRSRAINDIVVVGYGSTKQKDITGSVASVKSKDFNQTQNTTADQLIIGKVAGVQITTVGGAPGSGSRIRIRGGSSLNASNDPLIVIDGIPIDNFKMGGSANPLNMINPNDIESMDILKDASATAIYGSRASNGVILITTKKGTRKDDGVHVGFSSLNSVATPGRRRVDMLNTNEYRNLFLLTQDSSAQQTLGNADNNWQDNILRNAFSSDNNVSITGGIKGLPYRVSLGYLGQQGMVMGGGLDRGSFGVNINPSFFNNTLKVNAGVRSTTTKTRFTDEGAIGAANSFDPTQSIKSENEKFGNYFAWTDAFGNPISNAPNNPVSLVNQREDKSMSYRNLVNLQLDYKIPFVKGLRANLNLGYDQAKTDGNKTIPYTNVTGDGFFRGGKNQDYGESRTNKLIDFYLNYNKDILVNKLGLDVTAGYSNQYFDREYPTFDDRTSLGKYQTTNNIDSIYAVAGTAFATRKNIQSFFGRANFTIFKRFLLTGTLRNDRTSSFAPSVRSGFFPAVAAAWRINEESFLKDNKNVSNLKLRLGWGQTGQQEVYFRDRPLDYLYLPKYNLGDPTASYQFGNTFYQVYRPDAVDPNIKWETTTTTNAGLDFGFYKNRIFGSIDVYNRESTDLLANIPVSAGTALSNTIFTNVGNLTNRGIEIGLGFVPVASKNVTWEVNLNYTHNVNKIVKMTKYTDANFAGISVGGIDGGTGNNIQVLRPGYSINTFNALQQVYDTKGNPVEGAYVDQNGDGVINEKDLVTKYNSDPRDLFGFNTNVAYKRFTFGAVARAQFNGYNYNNTASNQGYLNAMRNDNGYNNNIHGSVFNTRFVNSQLLSNYYIENSSFFRLDNASLGYNFGAISKAKNAANLRASFMVQNVFVITNYTGLDPEVVKDGNSGIDKNIYPRPTTYSVGLNLDF
jgi:TonB-dependent starch-binding outer membrane protein SusC